LPRSLPEHSRRPGKPIDPEGAAAIAGMTLACAARCASRVLMISDRIAARSSSPVRFWNVLNVASRVGQRPQVALQECRGRVRKGRSTDRQTELLD
jgi:hypothetical protein